MNNISPYKQENIVLTKAFDFALEIIAYSELLEGLRKFNVANQIFRSGTPVHANIREAQNAESKADFIHKIKLSAKEAEEVEGWLLLCKHSPTYPDPLLLLEQILSLLKLLNKIIGTTKRKGS